MPKQRPNPPTNDLLTRLQAAERESGEAILAILYEHEAARALISLRLKAAMAANDAKAVERLQDDLKQTEKYREFYRNKLRTEFPDTKIPVKYDFRAQEDQAVVEDYLHFVALRSNYRTQYQGAVYSGNPTHQQMAQQEIDRAQGYINFFKPRFDRLARQDNAQAQVPSKPTGK